MSNENRLLPNFSVVESNKSLIIAFSIGTSSVALVSKVGTEYEHIDNKFGRIYDVLTNKYKQLLVLTSKGNCLQYDTSFHCQILNTFNMNAYPSRFLYGSRK